MGMQHVIGCNTPKHFYLLFCFSFFTLLYIMVLCLVFQHIFKLVITLLDQLKNKLIVASVKSELLSYMLPILSFCAVLLFTVRCRFCIRS